MSGLRTFLRYGQRVVELDQRILVIGRSLGADLVLDDDLCSREHCTLRVDGTHVLLVDLDSRNGVLVNGQRIKGEVEVHHGDTITIGRQQLTLTRQHRAPRETRPPATNLRESTDDTSTGSVFEMLSAATRNALRDKDLFGAEASASSYFAAVRTTVGRLGRVESGALKDAVELGLLVSEAAGNPQFLEQLLDLAVACNTPIDPAGAQRLYAIATKVGTPRRGVTEYLRMLDERPGDLSRQWIASLRA